MNTDYKKQGEDFLKDTGTTMKVKFIGNDIFWDEDKDTRDIYRITLERKGRAYAFRFGQSFVNSGEKIWSRNHCKVCRLSGYAYSQSEHLKAHSRKVPTAYDVLACLTKWNPGTLDNFASEYGYNDLKPSKLLKIYAAVVEEWEGVKLLFSDVMEKLQEIQ